MARTHEKHHRGAARHLSARTDAVTELSRHRDRFPYACAFSHPQPPRNTARCRQTASDASGAAHSHDWEKYPGGDTCRPWPNCNRPEAWSDCNFTRSRPECDFARLWPGCDSLGARPGRDFTGSGAGLTPRRPARVARLAALSSVQSAEDRRRHAPPRAGLCRALQARRRDQPRSHMVAIATRKTALRRTRPGHSALHDR
jgi:hypothetical protein